MLFRSHHAPLVEVRESAGAHVGFRNRRQVHRRLHAHGHAGAFERLAKPNQGVRGIIIALDDDIRLRRARSVAGGIEFFRYKVSFQLLPG